MIRPIYDYLIDGRSFFDERTCGELAICAFVNSGMPLGIRIIHYACCDVYESKSTFIHKKCSIKEIGVMEMMEVMDS